MFLLVLSLFHCHLLLPSTRSKMHTVPIQHLAWRTEDSELAIGTIQCSTSLHLGWVDEEMLNLQYLVWTVLCVILSHAQDLWDVFVPEWNLNASSWTILYAALALEVNQNPGVLIWLASCTLVMVLGLLMKCLEKGVGKQRVKCRLAVYTLEIKGLPGWRSWADKGFAIRVVLED